MRATVLASLLGGCIFEAPPAGVVQPIEETDASADAPDSSTPDSSTPDSGKPDVPGMISRVLSGTVSMANLAEIEVPIDAVVPERSVLWFSLSIDSNEPRSGLVRGQLVRTDALRFSRVEANASGRVVWYVTEFGPEVSVQRGTIVLPDDGDVYRGSLTPIDRTKSFILISAAKDGLTYDASDYFRATLPADDAFEISTLEDSVDGIVDWQVVTMARAAVTSGEVVLTEADYGVTATVAALNPDRSFLLTTWDAEGGISLIGPHVMRASYVDGELAFNRTVNGARMVVSWHLVELLDGSRVQGDVARLSPALTATVAPMSPVDRSRSIAFFSGNQRFGASSLMGGSIDGTDNLGVATFSAELVGDESLLVQRGATLGWGRPWWSVVEFAR